MGFELPDIDYAGIVKDAIKGGGQLVDDAADFVGFKEGRVSKATKRGGSSSKGASPINVPRRVVAKAKSTKAKTAVRSKKSQAKRPAVGKKVATPRPKATTGKKTLRRESKAEQNARAQRSDRRNRNLTDAQRAARVKATARGVAAREKAASKVNRLKVKRSKARKSGDTKRAHQLGRKISRRTRERGDT
jgi:hypothetical protein